MRILRKPQLAIGVSSIFGAILFTTLFVASLKGQERVFFGNLHSHTSYSDGSERPRDAYRYARDIARLDFLALTEHNHSRAMGSDGVGIATNNRLYNGLGLNSLIRSARDYTVDGRFVALYGQEFSVISRGNHMVPGSDFNIVIGDRESQQGAPRCECARRWRMKFVWQTSSRLHLVFLEGLSRSFFRLISLGQDR